MSKRLKVYIASPYTRGDVSENIKRQFDATEKLYELGFNVYAPITQLHFQSLAHPHNWNFWMSLCYEWIDSCDALLRIGGYSEGADMEVEYAKKKEIPVFYDILDIEYFYKSSKNHKGVYVEDKKIS